MKRTFQLLATITLCVVSFVARAAVIGTYDFTAGDSAVPTPANTTFTPFSQVNVSPAATAGTFTSSAWTTTTSRDPAEYVSFTVTANSGYELNLQTLSFNFFKSGSGPPNGLVEVFDGNTSMGTTPFSPANTSGSIVFDFTDFISRSTVTFRFYGWNANSAQGTLSFDDVALNGSVNAVPEPVNIALALFALGGTGVYAGRRLLRRK